MIIGNINDCSIIEWLKSINDDFFDAIEFMTNLNVSSLTKGKVNPGYKNVFGIYQEYYTHPLENAIWEAHKKYLDIQFIIDGTEVIAVSNVHNVKISQNYSEESDVLLGYVNDGVKLYEVHSGDFIVLFPDEVHLPGVETSQKSFNKKIVIKVPINALS